MSLTDIQEDNDTPIWILSVNKDFLVNEQNRFFNMFSLFYSAEFLLQDMERSGTSPMAFSRLFPFSSWLSYILTISSEHFMYCLTFENFHFLDILGQKQALLEATLIWYLVFFFPGDLIHNFCKSNFVFLIIVKDIESLRICLRTVCMAKEVYGKEPFIITAVSTMCANAAAFLIFIPRLVRGFWTMTASEFFHPKFKSKAIFAVSLAAYISLEWLQRCPDEIIFLSFAVFLAMYRICESVGMHLDYLFDTIEDLFNALLFEITDTLSGNTNRLRNPNQNYIRLRNSFDTPQSRPIPTTPERLPRSNVNSRLSFRE